MPEEIRAKLKQTSTDHKLKQTIKRNTEWVRLTQGLLLYYGALTLDDLFEKITYYLEGPVPSEYFPVISEAMEYHGLIEIDSYLDFVCHSSAIEPEEIIEEQELRQDIPFYPASKEELLEAGAPDYIDRNPHFRNLVRQLERKYGLDQELAELLADDSTMFIREGESPNAIMEMLSSEIMLEGLDDMSELMDIVVALSNNTRQWMVKGHKPLELGRNEFLDPPPQPKNNVVPFVRKDKTGRNDPCPCGSGKKYKKCCGR